VMCVTTMCSTRVQLAYGEMGRASGCRGTYMVYGGYFVVHEVEDASQAAIEMRGIQWTLLPQHAATVLSPPQQPILFSTPCSMHEHGGGLGALR